MTPAEHRTEAVEAVENLDPSLLTDEQLLLYAQVHATLALTPPPPPEKPQHRWSLDQAHVFPDATGGNLAVTSSSGKDGVIFTYGDEAWLMENPDLIRTLASLLTAHADRLEPRS